MANYVKFMRGTPEAFKKLRVKEADTLYFISEKDALAGKLYIGDKLVNAEITFNDLKIYFSNLEDVNVSNANHNDLLGYDATTGKWIPVQLNKFDSIIELKNELGNPQLKTGIYAELDKKSNKEEVYTKEQIDTIVTNINVLKKKKIDSLNDIDLNAFGADQYLYIAPKNGTKNDQYEEYIVVDKHVEKLGFSFINSIDTDQFEILIEDNRKLALKQIPIDKLGSLDNHETIKIIRTDIENLRVGTENRLSKVEESIQDLQTNTSWGLI